MIGNELIIIGGIILVVGLALIVVSSIGLGRMIERSYNDAMKEIENTTIQELHDRED